MNEIIFILILVFIIIIAGDNFFARTASAIGLFLLLACKHEDFIVLEESAKKKPIFNPSTVNDGMAGLAVENGRNSIRSIRGAQKNRVNYMNDIFADQMEYNENLDWWSPY